MLTEQVCVLSWLAFLSLFFLLLQDGRNKLAVWTRPIKSPFLLVVNSIRKSKAKVYIICDIRVKIRGSFVNNLKQNLKNCNLRSTRISLKLRVSSD